MIANPNIQRVDRKQLYYSTTEGSDDKIQVCNQVSERSRRRYDGVAVLIKFFNGDTVMGCWRNRLIFVGSKLPDKGVVQGVAATCVGRFDIDDQVSAGRP